MSDKDDDSDVECASSASESASSCAPLSLRVRLVTPSPCLPEERTSVLDAVRSYLESRFAPDTCIHVSLSSDSNSDEDDDSDDSDEETRVTLALDLAAPATSPPSAACVRLSALECAVRAALAQLPPEPCMLRVLHATPSAERCVRALVAQLSNTDAERVTVVSDDAADAGAGVALSLAHDAALPCALDVIVTLTQPAPWEDALQRGDLAAVTRLLRLCGPQLLTRRLSDANTPSALHVVAAHGHATLVMPLVHAGAMINVFSDAGFTPLHVAATHNHAECVRALLRHGAAAEARTRVPMSARLNGVRPRSALELAIDARHWATARVFAECAPRMCEAALDDAVAARRTEVVTALLDEAAFGVTNALLDKVAKDADTPFELLKVLVEHAKNHMQRDIVYTQALQRDATRQLEDRT